MEDGKQIIVWDNISNEYLDYFFDLDLSYVLELLKDLAASIELEKEPLRHIEDSKDLIE